MKVVRNVVLGIAVLFFAAMIAGLFMPSTFAVERAATIVAPPERVYERFATPRTWAEWSAWNVAADSTLRFVYEGPASGPGAVMKWSGRRMGNGTLRITDARPHATVRYEVRVAETPVVVRGHVRLAPADGGTRVTWSDSGEVGRNPVMRLMLPVIDGSLGNAFEIGFRGLARELEAPGGAGAAADSVAAAGS